MTPERYRQIGELYHTALALKPDERAAFLDQACAGDDPLRHEVERLLASNEEAGSFLAAPALTAAGALACLQVFASKECRSKTGDRLLAAVAGFLQRRMWEEEMTLRQSLP